MRFFSPLLILAALLAAACGGAAVFPEVFSQERADGKIPVNIELIKEQTRKEIDGMPEKLATAERWREIEADYNDCRLSSARQTKTEADKVFADCMSRMGYVYMLRLDAEQLHDEIAAEEPAKYAAEKKAEEEARLAAEKRRKEETVAAEKKAKAERVATMKKQIQDRRIFFFHKAVSNGDIDGVRLWLSLDVRPNATQDDGLTALMLAAQEGHAEIAEILLDAGANPNDKDNDGWTALIIAISKSYPEIAKMLLDAGANPNAARGDGNTALIWAAQEGYSKITKMLLDADANPNAAKDNGFTALMWAAQEGYPEIAKMLLDAGANPNAARGDGLTALMLAAQAGYSKIAKMLLDAGANPNMARDDGNTALIWAAYEGHAEIAKILLGAGANPNERDNKGGTALMIAAYKSHPDVAKILLDCGASPTQKTNRGSSAYDFANDRPAVQGIFYDYYIATQSGRRVSSCKGRWSLHVKPSIGGSVATAPPPSETNVAEAVFENVWQSIVVIRQGENQGSGVIVRPNMVATNCHVVDSYDRIVIYKHDNRRATTDTTFNAVIRHQDEDRDFCLLNVAGLQGKPAKVRRYDTLKIGEDVYAVGSPKGLDLSLSSGIISQLRQAVNNRSIQTDAAISPGSSGGGLFDSDSNFIGILTRKIADEKAEGLGFAIPAELILNL